MAKPLPTCNCPSAARAVPLNALQPVEPEIVPFAAKLKVADALAAWPLISAKIHSDAEAPVADRVKVRAMSNVRIWNLEVRT
ncbi:hypothetical protein [Roseovarius indicus]|uniref:hypothetical protein n=1 Tax=Roseovarius indicus TaxID=540747 RepID=UPI001F2EFA71|nr:hypothetical protein [Roseovarius indicus]